MNNPVNLERALNESALRERVWRAACIVSACAAVICAFTGGCAAESLASAERSRDAAEKSNAELRDQLETTRRLLAAKETARPKMNVTLCLTLDEVREMRRTGNFITIK